MSNTSIEVIQGDITQIEVDAIANAANTDLAAGGGVCGAIVSRLVPMRSPLPALQSVAVQPDRLS